MHLKISLQIFSNNYTLIIIDVNTCNTTQIQYNLFSVGLTQAYGYPYMLLYINNVNLYGYIVYSTILYTRNDSY